MPAEVRFLGAIKSSGNPSSKPTAQQWVCEEALRRRLEEQQIGPRQRLSEYKNKNTNQEEFKSAQGFTRR
jgi:hypothetical protein